MLALGLLGAQSPSPDKELRLRFGLVATRAVAIFRSADAIEGRLGAEGSGLSAQLVALRRQIEAALDQAESAVDNHDAAAGERIGRASALLDRFSQQLGGG